MSDVCQMCNMVSKYLKFKCCEGCHQRHKDDLIEIIFRQEDDQIGCRLFNLEEITLAENTLNAVGKVDIVTDLHGVLDTIDPLTLLPFKKDWSVVACSYVGKFSGMRLRAKDMIRSRIKNNQIKWGVLVFNRGSRNNLKTYHTFTKPGSKAWFVNQVRPTLFFDDGVDHINSVSSLNLEHLKCVKVDEDSDVMKLFESFN